MDFRLSEELEMIRGMVREFALAELAPKAQERDEAERFDRTVFGRMCGLGLTGIPWPEQFGGSGSGMLTVTGVLEELASVCASSAAALAPPLICGQVLGKFGDDSLKSRYLEGMADGTYLATYAMPPDKGAEYPVSGRMTRKARREADEFHGECAQVAHAGEADLYFVFAQDATQVDFGKREPPIRVSILERDTSGMTFSEPMSKMGMRSVMTGTMTLDACRISRANRIGIGRQGGGIQAYLLDYESVCTAAQAVGIAQGAMEAAIGYAKQRKQFGKPIGEQQAISFKLADMAAKIDGARLLTQQAAWMADEGLPFRDESLYARLYAVRMAANVTIETVQVFGGYGYMREYHVERYMRDAMCLN